MEDYRTISASRQILSRIAIQAADRSRKVMEEQLPESAKRYKQIMAVPVPI